MPRGGATKDENYSPPPEGCRSGLSRTGGTTPKADAFSPPKEGISSRDSPANPYFCKLFAVRLKRE